MYCYSAYRCSMFRKLEQWVCTITVLYLAVTYLLCSLLSQSLHCNFVSVCCVSQLSFDPCSQRSRLGNVELTL